MKRDLGYQSNAVDPGGQQTRELKPEEREKMQAVIECLGSNGYKVLHELFVEVVSRATTELCSFQTDEKTVRFLQGKIAAIQQVQHKFTSMSKEEGYVR